MKLSLYNIETEYLSIIEQVIANEGETTPELDEALALNKENLQVKAGNYGLVIREMKAQQAAIEIEVERLEKMFQAREKAVNRLKNNIATAMELYGVESIKAPLLNISFRKSEETVIDNLAQLPAEFTVTKTSVTPDKTKIKEAIKAGETVPGARIQINQNLQIK